MRSIELESGQVAVLKGWRDHQISVHYLNGGDCFGEKALLDLFPRSASVRDETDCSAMTLSCTDRYRLFERDAEQFALIQMNIGREISRRLRLVGDLLLRARVGRRRPLRRLLRDLREVVADGQKRKASDPADCRTTLHLKFHQEVGRRCSPHKGNE